MTKTTHYCDHCGKELDTMKDYLCCDIDVWCGEFQTDLCADCLNQLGRMVKDFCSYGKGRTMLKLFIKDNLSGQVHEYGTNRHDALILQEDGSLHYENMQNCTGTKFPEEGYSFCLSDGTIPQYDMVHGVEPYIDICGEYYAKK